MANHIWPGVAGSVLVVLVILFNLLDLYVIILRFGKFKTVYCEMHNDVQGVSKVVKGSYWKNKVIIATKT